ncbi:MAG: DUF6690 family protein [Pirellulales bacterium]
MRRLLTLLSVIAATLGPYLWNNPDVWAKVTREASAWFASLTSGSSSSATPSPLATQFASAPILEDNQLGLAPPALGDAAELPLAGPPVADIGELFRFDITPDWVMNRWARVTNVSTANGWQGLRVPVVTGTRVDDLAGSLTYYFDSLRQLQRITFKGSTGDARRVIEWSTTTAGMKREPTLATELYMTRWSGRPTQVLAIQRQPVMRASAAHSRIEVLLELSGPKNRVGVSQELLEWLAIHKA